MKKVKKRILCVILVLFCIYQPMAVYASSADHGGGGGTHEDGETSYEGDYTLKEFLEPGLSSPELAAFALTEISKLIVFVTNTGYGIVTGTPYEDIAKGFEVYNDSVGTGEWIHVDANNNVTYDQELIDLLKQFLEEYAQQHPDEVEKINYRIIHTMDYDTAFIRYADYKNALDGIVKPPEGSNSLAYWEEKWNAQTQYESFPRMILLSTYGRKSSPENVQDLSLSQSFSFFEGYEKGKTTCLIGEFGGTNWGSASEYHIGVYTYDSAAGSLSVDRRVTGFEQSCRFIWDPDDLIWNGTENWSYLFPSSGNAYINMSAGFWGGGWGYYAQNIDQEYGKRYAAVYNDDKSVTIPVLATPNGSTFRLFATEQDALRFFEGCADSGLNFDPNQVYTGGNITINNNGDVIINNGPGGGEDDPDGDSSGILGVLKDIRDWVKKIYNQVVIGNVINAIDALANVLDTLKNYLDEVAGDAAAIAELGEELVTKFPFSLPRDILLVVTLFEAEPVAPVWEIPFRADFGGPTGIKIDETFTIDFTDFKDAVDVLKWFLSLVWIFGLAMLTPKVLGIGGIGNSKGD